MYSKIFVVAAVAFCCFMIPEQTDAQLFKRRQAQSCPNGQCPQTASVVVQPVRTIISSQPIRTVVSSQPIRTAASVVAQPVRRTVTAVTAPIGGGHWTFPGNIDNHLQNTHGVSTAGMTYEQKLNLHDALHEGRATNKVYVPTFVVPSPTSTSTPAPVPSRTYAPTPAPAPTSILSPSPTTFGLSFNEVDILEETPVDLGDQLALALAEHHTIPEHVLAQVDTLPTPPTQVSETFKTSLLKAVVEARKNGKITLRDAVRIRVACLSPAFLERAQELAVVQIASSGEVSEAVTVSDDGTIEVASINWEGLAKFLEVFVPLLIQMLKAFGL